MDHFRKRLDSQRVPWAALKRINEEFDKLFILETGSPEYTVTRDYLDVIAELPWLVYPSDTLSLDTPA